MLRFESEKGVEFCDGLTRRDFLRAGALGAGTIGLTLADLNRLPAATPGKDLNCILLFLVGGPSQLDTWDPKPDAPDSVRGPFRPIQTNVPGTFLAEPFPLMARSADRFALLRSVHHDAAPIHETGHQLMQTGRLSHAGQEFPHYGSVLSHLHGPRAEGVPAFTVLPAPIGNTGVSVGHGQGAGFLGARHEPFVLPEELRVATGLDPARLSHRSLVEAIDRTQRVFDVAAETGRVDAGTVQTFGQLFSSRAKRAYNLANESDYLREQYGRNTFGQSCLLARRLVEHGTRLVTVNMFDSVFNQITWDCHADGGCLSTRLEDYRTILGPMFDRAYTSLLEDLRQRGLLETTLVVAMGEFGRTPQLNPRGGRDHWPGVWSILFAGAGVRGGQVIGSSDANGAEPRDRPISPAMVAASVYQGLGIDPGTQIAGPDNQAVPLAEGESVHELFQA